MSPGPEGRDPGAVGREPAQAPLAVVVSGAGGFIGRNLLAALARTPGVEARGFDSGDAPEAARALVRSADVLVHLAGVNRPEDPADFERVNSGFTRTLCGWLDEGGRAPLVVFSSSAQVERGTVYGQSKKAAEDVLEEWAGRGSGAATVFRLDNVFGKWGLPEYNSVLATFCHHIARDLPVRVDDEASQVSLIHIDDVVAAFCGAIDEWRAERRTGFRREAAGPVETVALGYLAARLREFRALDGTSDLPQLSGAFEKKLYATYLSYAEPSGLLVRPELHEDPRGTLGELLRRPDFGQVFASTTRPGVVRGNHYHDHKAERFIVLRGQAKVRLRRLDQAEVHEYEVDGGRFEAVVIPPGYVHSLENVGGDELVVLFWSDEVFCADAPDTYPAQVQATGEGG
jgi:UDP-2-acetamido-2,6-beta-L-arabino-hexul-4-ose reductase